MREYVKFQIRVIKRYARLIHTDDESACKLWTVSGLAKSFAIKHREQYGLLKEVV